MFCISGSSSLSATAFHLPSPRHKPGWCVLVTCVQAVQPLRSAMAYGPGIHLGDKEGERGDVGNQSSPKSINGRWRFYSLAASMCSSALSSST
jgi:hypothetical protein